MALKTAARANISPFIVMDVMRAANRRQASGASVLHLEVGQPSTAAPPRVLAAAAAALQKERLGYTDAFGLPVLREAIAKHYEQTYGLTVDPARLIATAGSSGAFILAFLACFEAGDRVARATPGYPAYRNILSALGGEVIDIPVGPETGYRLSVEAVAQIPDLDGLVIASPNNPTGVMIEPSGLEALVAHCRERGIRLISDEIYHGITYEQKAQTVAALDDQAVIINSFSKYFSMTGWRLGWMVAPETLLRPLECLAQNLFISPPTLSQHAAVTAFDCTARLDANVARYQANREILLAGLPEAGFTDLAPADGAFYIYANVAHLTDDASKLAGRLLAETGIAVTPGTDFDPERGHRFLRFSFAGATEDMREAVSRLKDWRRRRGVVR